MFVDLLLLVKGYECTLFTIKFDIVLIASPLEQVFFIITAVPSYMEASTRIPFHYHTARRFQGGRVMALAYTPPPGPRLIFFRCNKKPSSAYAISSIYRYTTYREEE